MKRLVLCMLLITSGCAQVKKSLGRTVDSVNGTVDRTRQRSHDIGKRPPECEELITRAAGLEEEFAIGGALAIALASGAPGGLLVDLPATEKTPHNELTRYLNGLGRSLAAYSTRPDLPWTFAVLDDDAPNAFSAPGGYVFVTTGLLKLVVDEAQLGGVLAHEITHVTQRHALKVFGQVKANQCTVMAKSMGVVTQLTQASSNQKNPLVEKVTGAFNFSPGKLSQDIIAKATDGLVDSLTTQGFAHADEFQADDGAYELLLFAGYDPEGFGSMLTRLPDSGRWMTHHPKTGERLKNLKLSANKYEGFAPPGIRPDITARLAGFLKKQ